ncbi:MAG: DUF6316 family protein [Gammaproteobacteria bacterium]|nr:DUF6316 family protein [Gammaproteobacteria bacterium]
MTQTNEVNIRKQSGRLFQSDDQSWYLRTREGTKGPFADQPAAEQYLYNYVLKGEILAYNEIKAKYNQK